MNPINHALLILSAFLAIYFQSSFDLFRNLFGTQFDFLPALIVYASLTHSILFVALFAFCSGMFYDSLSANPLGISVLPLFIVALFIYKFRVLLLRERTYPQFILGITASVAVPLLTLLALITVDQQPLFGFGTIWQLLVLAALGGLTTPLVFRVLDKVGRTFNYSTLPESSFRPDREIKRGKGLR